MTPSEEDLKQHLTSQVPKTREEARAVKAAWVKAIKPKLAMEYRVYQSPLKTRLIERLGGETARRLAVAAKLDTPKQSWEWCLRRVLNNL